MNHRKLCFDRLLEEVCQRQAQCVVDRKLWQKADTERGMFYQCGDIIDRGRWYVEPPTVVSLCHIACHCVIQRVIVSYSVSLCHTACHTVYHRRHN